MEKYDHANLLKKLEMIDEKSFENFKSQIQVESMSRITYMGIFFSMFFWEFYNEIPTSESRIEELLDIIYAKGYFCYHKEITFFRGMVKITRLSGYIEKCIKLHKLSPALLKSEMGYKALKYLEASEHLTLLPD